MDEIIRQLKEHLAFLEKTAPEISDTVDRRLMEKQAEQIRADIAKAEAWASGQGKVRNSSEPDITRDYPYQHGNGTLGTVDELRGMVQPLDNPAEVYPEAKRD